MHFVRKAIGAFAAGALLSSAAVVADTARTKTPIKHPIVVVGEKMSFDNLFATYESKPGATVRNLLSAGIVNRDGSPGRNFAKAAQRRAEVGGIYQVTPKQTGTYTDLPQVLPVNYADVGTRDIAAGATLSNGPFQITKHGAYIESVGNPVRGFFPMWQ